MIGKMRIFFVVAACVLMLFAFTATAMAGTAANVAISWDISTTVGENFNFGNPASVSSAKLPQQVQTSIGLGTLAAYFNAALLFGF